MRRAICCLLPVASLAALIPALPARAEAPVPPPFYAIKDARVATGDGRALERATVLLADGLIEAVGVDLPIPEDAWVIEGAGLTVYPALIDGLTTLGRKKEEKPAGGGRGPSGPLARGPEDRPATTPWASIADNLGDDERIATWRKAGFGAAVSAPDEGIFTGQASLLHLGEIATEQDLRRRVLATPVAQRVNLAGLGGFRNFPGSLMGAIAYVRQTLSDARHYRQAQAIYAANPKGLERPAYDRALEPLAASETAGTPWLLPGDVGKEIDRALALGAEFDLPAILYGGQGAYARTESLKAAGTPVVVSLDWPKAAKDGDPEADTPFAQLYHRRMAPTTPAALAAAGVPFAFSSASLAGPDEIFAAVRRAIEEGLSNEQALAALTSAPARIYGAGPRLGTVEAGKIANLVVATDWPWAEEVEIAAVFVAGRRYAERKVEEEEKEAKEEEKPPAEGEAEVAANGEPEAEAGEEDEEKPEPVPLDEVEAVRALYQGPAARLDAFAITGATVWTVSGETLESGTVLVDDGKIVGVGAGLAVPAGFEVIDAAGMHLIPGIFDAHSHIAVDGSVNEGSLAVTSMVGTGDALDPDDVGIYRALAGGVTTANILHGSANPIGGKNAVIKLRWGADAQGLLLDGAAPGIKFALGENPKRSNFSNPNFPARHPQTRMGVMDVIRQAFTEAREYQREWNAYRAASAAAGGSRRGRRGAEPAATIIPPRRDLELEALVEILEGRRLVHSHCYRADEILQLLRLAEEFGFRIATLQHVLEGYKVADEIAAHGAGASTFSDWWGYKVEAYDAIPHNAALMTERGVVVSINSDSGEEMRHLNQEAAKAMRWGGMSELQALAMVTLNPARQFGLEDRIGSIEVGKDADLVLYDGHPLALSSVVQKTFVDGDLYFDLEADRERPAAIDAMKKRLAAVEEKPEPGEDGESPPTEEKEEPTRLGGQVANLWNDELYSCREVAR
jgi:imidazolonepropionase-like amidohydrolase